MSEEPEFFSYTRDEFLDAFFHPDDRPALEEAHQKRGLAVRAEYLTEIRQASRPDPGRSRRDHGRVPAARSRHRERLSRRALHPG
jgi:hypothetical protein